MAGEEKRGGSGGLFAWVLVIALLGVVLWLASERNARKWFLTVDGKELVVARGRNFPTGTRNIDAKDAEWGKAYGPIALPQGAKPVEGEFDDRTQLDRALFDQLLPLAKAAADKLDAASQAQAMELSERASLLPGLSAQQLEQLQGLRGDLAYAAALGQLRQLPVQLDSLRALFEQAHERGGHHAAEAHRLAAQLKQMSAELNDAAAGRAPANPQLAPTGQPPPAPAPLPAQPPAADAGATDAGTSAAGAADAGK